MMSIPCFADIGNVSRKNQKPLASKNTKGFFSCFPLKPHHIGAQNLFTGNGCCRFLRKRLFGIHDFRLRRNGWQCFSIYTDAFCICFRKMPGKCAITKFLFLVNTFWRAEGFIQKETAIVVFSAGHPPTAPVPV